VVALCGLIYLPSLFWSLGLDQNIFAEIGSLLLQGKKLYVDAWDVKPPNVFYIYALFQWIFGKSEFVIRLSDYIFAIIAFVGIIVATQREAAQFGSAILQKWAGPLAAILLALTLLSLGLADTAQTESYSLAFIIGAVVLALNNNVLSRYSLFLTGIFIAIATFFKTTNAIFFIPIILEIFFRDRAQFAQGILSVFAGFILWTVLQLGVLAIEGSLSEYLRITYSVLTHHSSEISQFGMWSLPRAMWTYLDIWSILAVAAIVTALVKSDKAFLRLVRMPLLFLVAGMVSVIVQNKGWGYQYVVLLPGLIMLCAICSLYLYELIQKRNFATAAFGMIALLLVTLTITPSARRRIHYCSDALLSIRDHSAYVTTLGARESLYYPAGTDSLAKYLSAHTSPTDGVFIFGEEPGAYWKSGRIPAARFVYSLLFTSGVIPDSDLIVMTDSLVRKKPALIVVERFDTTAFRGRPETSESQEEVNLIFVTLKNLLVSNYRVSDTLCNNYIVYQRKGFSN
jgi:hypothetical protein